MANTYTSLHYHIAFSTKHRKSWITPDVEQRVWAYLGGIAKQNDIRPLAIGGIDDHVHLLLGLPPIVAVSQAVQWIKGGSSKWIHEEFSGLGTFAWQDGYGAFTIGRSQLARTIAYISRQREHHRRRSFAEEYLAFLRKHEIAFDERYALD